MPSISDYLTSYLGSGDYPTSPEGQYTPADVLLAINKAGTGIAQADVGLTENIKKLAQYPGDVYSGKEPYLPPGLRREDFTDIPYEPKGLSTFGAEPLDPQIGKTAELSGNLMGVGTQFAQPGSAGMLGGKLFAERMAEQGDRRYLDAWNKAEALAAQGLRESDIYAQTKQGGITGVSTGKEGGFRVETPDIGTDFTPFAGKMMSQRSTASLPEVYNHPEAYKAFPEFKNVTVAFQDPTPSASARGYISKGGYDPSTGTLYINPDAPRLIAQSEGKILSPEQAIADMRSTLLHEMQHISQAMEAFPTGAGIEAPVVQRATQQELATRGQVYRREIERLNMQREQWLYDKRRAEPGITPEAAMQGFLAENPQFLEQIGRAKFGLHQLQDPRSRMEMAFANYQRVAGEAEARNVQRRADLTPEVLAQLEPRVTEDVPRGEQLLHYRDVRKDFIRPETGPAQGSFNFSQEPVPGFQERMQAGREANFQRAQRGQSVGNYGLPVGGNPTAPVGPPGSFDRLAAETRAGFQADKGRIIDQYREATGQAPAGRPEPILAPGERPEDLQFEQRPFQPNLGGTLESLISPMSGVGTPSRPGAPYVRNPNAPLFDYSRLGERIDTPQFGLQRTLSTDVQPEYLRAGERGNVARVNKIVEQGIREGGLDWHNLLPLKEEYMAELGPQAGAQAFEDYIRRVGATSPNSNVLQNYRTASYYDHLLRTGQPLPEVITSPKGNPMIAKGEIPYPYGNTAQGLHVMNLNALAEGGYPLSRPKPPSFAENLLGNYTPVAVDRHNLTLWGINRESPNLTGYRYLEELQQQQARKMGIDPAQYQAAGWLPYAQSGAEPALQLFEKSIASTAEHMGLSKGEVLRQFIRGQLPLR